MSINQLISSDDKPWLNVSVNSLTVDGQLNFGNASGGAITFNQWVKTSETIAVAGDINALRSVNLIDTSSGNLAMTMPAVSDCREVCLINIGANNFTVDADDIGGDLSYTVPSGETMTVVSDGSGWYVKATSQGTTST